MNRHIVSLASLLAIALPSVAQTAPTPGAIPPKTWVDADTGHRVWRLTDEPGSSGFYFNVNAYTPDLKTMIYTAPDGIRGMDMATRQTRLIVPNPPKRNCWEVSPVGFGGLGTMSRVLRVAMSMPRIPSGAV